MKLVCWAGKLLSFGLPNGVGLMEATVDASRTQKNKTKNWKAVHLLRYSHCACVQDVTMQQWKLFTRLGSRSIGSPPRHNRRSWQAQDLRLMVFTAHLLWMKPLVPNAASAASGRDKTGPVTDLITIMAGKVYRRWREEQIRWINGQHWREGNLWPMADIINVFMSGVRRFM